MLHNIRLFEASAQSMVFRSSYSSNVISRFVTTLTPDKITHILRRDEISIDKKSLPSYVKSLECNQIGSNSPIEDRIRISSVKIPGCQEPTLFLGVFDGHGGGTTVDLISRRLFKYIEASLYPKKLDLQDLHHSPQPKHDPTLRPDELESLQAFRAEIGESDDVQESIRTSFNRCDEDLSREIQRELQRSQPSHAALHYYLSAAVSGCCAIVMILHNGMNYLASVGDCRGVLGTFVDKTDSGDKQANKFTATELIDEHNCDNVNEMRRLTTTHPSSEQNTIVRHNRLLGHLMPFRAFGDFNYKWSPEVIKACGLTRAFGNAVIPAHYESPPYLIAEPEVIELPLNSTKTSVENEHKCIVLATDGLWELFESSRDVIETVVFHSEAIKDIQADESQSIENDVLDKNCATHIVRYALGSGSHHPNCSMDLDEVRRAQHARLEAMLTLPNSISRNFRDDISIIVLKLS